MYEYSIFNYYIEIENTKIIKNSNNQNVISISTSIFEKIKNKYYRQNDELIKTLFKLGFLVESKEEEITCYLSKLENFLIKPKSLTLVIAPTLSCNFRCTYCYENNIKRDGILSKDEINNFFDNINIYKKKNNIEKICIILFGGEPLIAPLDILNYLNEKIILLNIPYSTDIITNGYEYNFELEKLLKKFNINKYQITLDGTPNIHDLYRKHINNKPTFFKIISNTKIILEKEIANYIVIRINCTTYNIKKVYKLIDFIAENFPNKKDKIHFSLGILMEGIEKKTNGIVIKNKLNKADLKIYSKLYYYIALKGFPSVDHYCISNICMNKSKGKIMLAPRNNYYKCMRAIGQKNLKYSFEAIDYTNFDYKLFDYCKFKGCPYIPYCHLGCLFNNYIKSGKQQIDCKFEMLDFINKEILYEYYK